MQSIDLKQFKAPIDPIALPIRSPFNLFQCQAESNWAADDDTPKTAMAVSAGVNGTTCSAYPACVDVGIKDARGIGSV